MKFPSERLQSRPAASRTRPYPTERQRRVSRKLPRHNVRSQHPEYADPPRSTFPRRKTGGARLDPSSLGDDRGGVYRPHPPATQPVGDESPHYPDERDDYGDDFVDDFVGSFASDDDEEKASRSNARLEQYMDQWRQDMDQVKQYMGQMNKIVREGNQQTRNLTEQVNASVQQLSELKKYIQEQPKDLVERILPGVIQGATSIMQGKQDQAHHGGVGEHRTIDPLDMFGTGGDPFDGNH